MTRSARRRRRLRKMVEQMPLQKPEASGVYEFGEGVQYMKVAWEIHRLNKETMNYPIKILCEFGGFEARGEFEYDAVAFMRMTPETWPRVMMDLAVRTIESARKAQAAQ